MTRRTKSFNFNDLFLAGQNSATARNLLIRSPLVGVMANAYNRAGGRVRVGAIDTAADTYIKSVYLVTTHGVPVAEVTSNSTYTDIYFNTSAGNSFVRHKSGWRRLNTGNPKYLQNKLSVKSEHEAADSFDDAVKDGYGWVGIELRGMIDRLVDQAMGEGVTRAPVFGEGGFGHSIDASLITAMARVFAGEMSPHEVSISHRTEFQRLFNMYTDKREKFNGALVKAVDFLTGEKWIFANNVNGGVTVGAISDTGLLAAIEKYKSGEALPTQQEGHFNYAVETVPMQWYPSFEHVPGEIRSGIEFSLAMLKTHRNAEKLLPDCTDIWQEMGCASIFNHHGATLYVLAK
jgi:hypothetical protein